MTGSLAVQPFGILLGTGTLHFGVPVLGAGQALPQTAEPVPWPPSARLASRLHAFATNLHD